MQPSLAILLVLLILILLVNICVRFIIGNDLRLLWVLVVEGGLVCSLIL